MKVVKNPFRINSYLLELSSSELQYYRHVLRVLPQNDFIYE